MIKGDKSDERAWTPSDECTKVRRRTTETKRFVNDNSLSGLALWGYSFGVYFW